MTEFPWHKQYPASVDREVNYEAYSSIVELFDESVKKFGSSVAFECMGKTMTYSELDKLSIQFANYLRDSSLNCV